MNTTIAKALSYFDPADKTTPKLNCGQAVLAALGEEIGVDEQLAVRVARGFAGGVGHQGDVCGALCGAVIALGIALDDENEGRNRARTYARARELFRQFRTHHGDVVCRNLIGVDPSTPEGEREVKDRNIHRTHCTRFVQSAVEISQSLLDGE